MKMATQLSIAILLKKMRQFNSHHKKVHQSKMIYNSTRLFKYFAFFIEQNNTFFTFGINQSYLINSCSVF